jgi:hypothetical protein
VDAVSIIQKEIELVGSKGRRTEAALFDSGASYSFIEREIAEQLETILPLPIPLVFETAKQGETIQATMDVRLFFYLGGYQFSDNFIVVSGLSERVIIGALTFQKWRLKLDFEHDEVIIDPRVTRLLFI